MNGEQLTLNTIDRFESEISLGVEVENNDRLKLLGAQNAELLRLLESEEAHNAQLASENDSLRSALLLATEKNQRLDESSKQNTELVGEDSKERLLLLEEIRVLREEVDLLKTRNDEESMKKTVEIESLHDHLRVVKNKQYQLLSKLQRLEEARKQSEDQIMELEDRIEKSQLKSSSLEAQIKLETQTRINHEEMAKSLNAKNELLTHENKELSSKIYKLSQDQLKSEADLTESSEQLRVMAEKVFQLLERLKITELAKAKITEAMQTKEQELFEWQKKHAQVTKEYNSEAIGRTQLETEKKAIEDQLRALKKQHTQLGQRCKEEAKAKLQAEDHYKLLEEKNDTLNAKISSLQNRLMIEEAEQGAHKEHAFKLKQTQENLLDRNETLQEKLHLIEESSRELSHELITKSEELLLVQAKFDALNLLIQEQDDLKEQSEVREKIRRPVDEADVLLAEGRLRFFAEYNKELAMVTVHAKNPKDRKWIENKKCNQSLRRIMRKNNVVESLLNHITELYGVVVSHEDEVERIQEMKGRHDTEMDSIKKKLTTAIQKLTREEESKVSIILKFLNEVKHATFLELKLNGAFEGAKLNFSRSHLSDEAVHAICAELQCDTKVRSINLRGNIISDDSCGAIASLLSETETMIKFVDLRENRIGRSGIKTIVDALERSPLVKKVRLRNDGRIEVYGELQNLEKRDSEVEDGATKISLVDVRNNLFRDSLKSLGDDFLGLNVDCEP